MINKPGIFPDSYSPLCPSDISPKSYSLYTSQILITKEILKGFKKLTELNYPTRNQMFHGVAELQAISKYY